MFGKITGWQNLCVYNKLSTYCEVASCKLHTVSDFSEKKIYFFILDLYFRTEEVKKWNILANKIWGFPQYFLWFLGVLHSTFLHFFLIYQIPKNFNVFKKFCAHVLFPFPGVGKLAISEPFYYYYLQGVQQNTTNWQQHINKRGGKQQVLFV